MLSQIDQIDLSSNFLDGKIPGSIGEFKMLIYLNHSCNLFESPIPNQLNNLTSLELLDLSSNDLSGTIPTFFANFTYLSTLNLSFNRLDGQIPEGGVFLNLTLQSLIGNVGLCGAPRIGFPPCLDKSHSSNKHLLKFQILIVIITFGGIAICLYLCIKKRT